MQTSGEVLFFGPLTLSPKRHIYWNSSLPGDSKWPFHPLVGGHLTNSKGHLAIPKRSQRIARSWYFNKSPSRFDWILLQQASRLPQPTPSGGTVLYRFYIQRFFVKYPGILRILGFQIAPKFSRKMHENTQIAPPIAPPISQGPGNVLSRVKFEKSLESRFFRMQSWQSWRTKIYPHTLPNTFHVRRCHLNPKICPPKKPNSHTHLSRYSPGSLGP